MVIIHFEHMDIIVMFEEDLMLVRRGESEITPSFHQLYATSTPS